MFSQSNRRYPFYGPGYASTMVPCFAFATVCCSFFSFTFCIMGLIMTITAYTGPQFRDDPTKILGPIFLCLGLIFVCIAIGMGCYTMKKKKALESQTAQNQATQSADEPQPYSAYSGPNNPCPDVYDPEKRGLTADVPSSYSTSFGQPPASQMPYPMPEPGSNLHVSEKEKLATHPPNPVQQPSYNPDFNQPPPSY